MKLLTGSRKRCPLMLDVYRFLRYDFTNLFNEQVRCERHWGKLI